MVWVAKGEEGRVRELGSKQTGIICLRVVLAA